MTEWANFFVAMAGAAAALTGLIFVGISISLARILSGTKISGRGLESLILLFTIVIVSALGLVPGQTARSLGMEVLGLGVLLWVLCLRLDLRMIWQTEKAYKKHYRLNLILSQAAVLPYLASGAVFLARGEVGLYWLIPAFFFSFGKALADAWVLLVEINR